ncbi:uncharacterized protein BDR25DRAFT_345028 [Lindgomyces ingoldianus]|uniref:Uncharacterized protein n=1 Tax=Lindgomyces ingoldianus TaxID=673940 RepID=A0ACB6QK37_9PLEO|nr:uncharacterized protein BDR25DRAFT_345028 [Lindgomyces ingoldianus]KAF2467265.1 hypothetical protein BDR25DRAFT_345028 [Lindgomyces ingoldianus]
MEDSAAVAASFQLSELDFSLITEGRVNVRLCRCQIGWPSVHSHPFQASLQDMLVAVSLLAISLSILIYHHPPSTWRALLSPAEGPARVIEAEQMSQNGGPVQSVSARQERTEPQAYTDRETEETSTSSSSPQTTPKAVPSAPLDSVAIPTFALVANESSDEDEGDLPPPSFPAANSAQRTSVQSSLMPSPPTPASMAPPPSPAASSLMAPPPRIVPSNLRALPTFSEPLRMPTTGPLPNRGPAPNRAPSVSNGGLTPSVKTTNARGKVLLSPGHSPLDWASLQRSGKNLSGVPSLIRVTPSQLKYNNGRKEKPAWSSYQGKVYNITPYLPFHPGGEGELRRAAGKDGTKLFMEVHPWVNWENMLGECVVGVMVSEEQAQSIAGGSLEDMD